MAYLVEHLIYAYLILEAAQTSKVASPELSDISFPDR